MEIASKRTHVHMQKTTYNHQSQILDVMLVWMPVILISSNVSSLSIILRNISIITGSMAIVTGLQVMNLTTYHMVLVLYQSEALMPLLYVFQWIQ